MKALLRRMADWIVDALIARAMRTPYSHLWHPDGTPYMERYWLFRSRFFSVRLHRILSIDMDPHMHDHPWDFVSVVLRGEYIEALPEYQDRHTWLADGRENDVYTRRRTFSIARRRHTDRHRIVWLTEGGIWTLFATSPKKRNWGFHTPAGWVLASDYPSCHAAGAAPRVES